MKLGLAHSPAIETLGRDDRFLPNKFFWRPPVSLHNSVLPLKYLSSKWNPSWPIDNRKKVAKISP
jgi:hypothetical protein